MHTWNRYIATLLVLGLLVPGSLLFMSNIVVDPYSFWNVVSIKGFNRYKPALENRVELARMNQARRGGIEAIVLGTSRAGFVNVVHPGWADYNVHNMSIPGSRMSQIIRAGVLSNPDGELRLVVFGLDLFAFTDPNPVELDFHSGDAGDAASVAGMTTRDWIADAVRFTLSSATLVASIETVSYNTRVAEAAAQTEPKSLRHLDKTVRIGAEMAMSKELRRYNLQAESFFGVRSEANSLEEVAASSLRNLRDFLSYCAANGIQVRMFFSPVHATMLELYSQIGVWDNFEDLKRSVTQMAEKANTESDTASIELWDFSGYNAITTERVPAGNEEKPLMQNYYESSHYRPIVGDMMLGRMFSVPDQNESFGLRLTIENVETHLARIREDRERYRQSPDYQRMLVQFPLLSGNTTDHLSERDVQSM